jgi:hypothetical protein
MRKPGRNLDSCSSSTSLWTQGLKKSVPVSAEMRYLKLPAEKTGPALTSSIVPHVSWPRSSSESPAMVPAKKTIFPVAPWGKTAANASSSSRPVREAPSPRREALYHSPEAVKLELPETTSHTTSMQASALFHTPYRVLRTLQCVTPFPVTRNDDESISSSPLYPQTPKDYFDNGDASSSSTMGSIVTAATLATRAPFSARLTQDMLQRHEKLAEGSPSSKLIPHFAGDKLAKIVIRKKTQHELAKEQKRRVKDVSQFQAILAEEDDRVEAVLVQGNNDAAFGGKRVRWLEEELKVAASSNRERKQKERQERIHEEQLHLSELERRGKLKAAEVLRQRKLRATELLHQSRLHIQDQPHDEFATSVESMQSSREPDRPRLVSPRTPKIRRSTGTLIDI